MPRGKNCRETIFAAQLPRNYPHHGGSLERGKNVLCCGGEAIWEAFYETIWARVIESQKLPRDSGESIFAARHQDVSQGPLGVRKNAKTDGQKLGHGEARVYRGTGVSRGVRRTAWDRSLKNWEFQIPCFEEFFWGGNTLGLAPASLPYTLGYACTFYAPTSPPPKNGQNREPKMCENGQKTCENG